MQDHTLFSLLTLAVFLLSSSEGATNDYLDAHNEARAAVGVQPLTWSDTLAKATSLMVRYQRNNLGCQFANLTASKYGGNQLWSGSAAGVAPRTAVGEWVKEKNFYNHSSNTCVSNHECGVYTQVVWKNTAELGCSQAICVKEKASLTICFYDPPGNVIGETPY